MKRYELPSDRRTPARVMVTVPIKLRIKDSSSEVPAGKLAEVTNLGLGGLSLVSEAHFPVSSTVILLIESPLFYPPIEMRAQIIWRDSLREGEKFRYGAQFLNLEEEQLSTLKKLMDSLKRKVFTFEKTVYLTDTNAEGNTYFSSYFDWQGMAREEFVKEVVPQIESLFKRIKFITVKASMLFKQETKLFDQVVVKLQIREIKSASVTLSFTFLNKKTNSIVALGRQTIAFADSSGRLVPTPKEIKENIESYLEK